MRIVNLTVVVPIAVTEIQIPRIAAWILNTRPVIRPLISRFLLYILAASLHRTNDDATWQQRDHYKMKNHILLQALTYNTLAFSKQD